jgi:hypothetical protein
MKENLNDPHTVYILEWQINFITLLYTGESVTHPKRVDSEGTEKKVFST